MIWLAERIAALVVIILILRSWWHSQAWLQTAVVFVLNGAGRIFSGLCTGAPFMHRFIHADRMDLLVLGLARPTNDRMAGSNQSSRVPPAT